MNFSFLGAYTNMHTNILFVEILLYFLIAVFVFFIDIPEAPYNKRFLRGFKIFGASMMVWSIFLTPSLLFANSSSLPAQYMLTIKVSGYYLFLRLLVRSSTLLLYPDVGTKLTSIIIHWVFLTLCLVISLFTRNETIIMVTIYFVVAYTVIESIVAVFLTVRLYKKTITELDNFYHEGVNNEFRWIYELLIVECLWLLVGFFILRFSALAQAFYVVIGLIIFMYNFILYTRYVNAMPLFLQKMGVSRMLMEDEEGVVNNEGLLSIHTMLNVSDENSKKNNERIEKFEYMQSYIDKWIEEKLYLKEDLNIDTLVNYIGSNRMYVSNYINAKYGLSFRSWVSSLRIEYAKKIIKEDPQLKIVEVAEVVHLTKAGFSTLFKKHEGITVSDWRKRNNI